MKRFLSSSFMVLALIVSAVGAAPSAHAQFMGDPNAPGQNAPTAAEQAGTAMPAPDPAAAAIVDKAAAATPVNNQLGPANPEFTFNGIMVFIASLFAWLLGVAAITLDNAVFYTVVTMGNYVKDLQAVGITWRIMRDLGNIVLIFGFLAIGISIILNTERLGWGKKMLPMLLVAAVFLNFSLFFSEAIIDTGNLFATQFYQQINGGNPAGKKNFDLASVRDEGISSKIMTQLGLQTIYGKALNPADAKKMFQNSALVAFMSIILFMVAAFVFFSLAFILIARFVILLLLIIIAPIGFAGLAIPQLAGTAKKWWDTLFEQTLTAPVLLLLLYVAIAVITDAKFITGLGSNANWTGFIPTDAGTTNYTGFAGLILSFLVAMGLLFFVVIASKKLSAFGAAGATKLASKLSGASLAAAAPGWAGRHTVGLGANYAAKKLRGTAFGKSFVGRGFADTLEKKVAGASFDVRNTSLGKSAEGLGLDLGKGQKGGYRADLEERVKSYERAAAGIEGRKMTKEEETAVNQSVANQKVSEGRKAVAQNERNAANAENSKQKAEVNRLKKEQEENIKRGGPDPETERKLDAAHQSLTASDTALAAAEAKLAEAETGRVARVAEATKLVQQTSYATSKKGAQEAYADRLKNVWGKVPIFGTAAAAAASRVKSNAGKTKNQLAIEAFMVKAQEAAAAGGTTIPTATPPPVATQPPTGGAPHS